MCGRFALATDKKILAMLYGLDLRADFELRPRYNIAPSQKVLTLRLSPENGEKELTELKWGFVPFWADDPAIGNRMINARAETAAEKPSFRNALKKRRLLVPASGFYEWKSEDGNKQPFFIYRRDEKPFSFAGLWERWDKGSDPLESFTILTTEPNSLLSDLHNRMPVIIRAEDYSAWLNPDAEPNFLQQMMVPFPSEELTFHPVSKKVNKPSNDHPEIIQDISEGKIMD